MNTATPVAHYICPSIRRSRLLMLSYHCSPFRASDWRVGWRRAVEAAKRFDVFVITCECSRDDIETYLRQNGVIPNLRFFYVDCQPRGAFNKLIRSLFTNSMLSKRPQADAIELARKLHAQYQFDLAHDVGSAGFLEPGRIHELDIPFLWGPVDGAQSYPVRFLLSAGLVDGFKEASRFFINWLQMQFGRRVRRIIKSATVVLAATSDGQRAIEKHHGHATTLLLETDIEIVAPKTQTLKHSQPLRVLWSGDLVSRKGIHLLLRALGSVRSRLEFELHVLGCGPLLAKSRRIAGRAGIQQHCQFLGSLPLPQAIAQYEWADVFVFTSLCDSSHNLLLEAMSRGVPVICFDHQSAADIVTNECGIKIPITNPQAAIRDFGNAFITVASDRHQLALLSEGALRCTEHFLRRHNEGCMADIYKQVLNGSLMKSVRPNVRIADAELG
jgi:glycosyltransferase involved in cell wall biosynthesis